MDEALLDAVASARFIMGPQVRELETELAEYVGVRHCISCANGTDALDIALKVWGIGPGDAVFVPDFTFFSSAEVVALEGATPVFVDVCEDTFNIDPRDLENAIKQTVEEGALTPKAIVAVDLFGQPADFRAIREIAGRYGLKILEDGAQGFGGSCDGIRACCFGDISTTSFFPAKPLGCYGDGGAIFTDNDEWAALADSIRVHGKGTMKYDNVRIGMNSRLDTLQAAVLLVKFRAFREYELEAVQAAARKYDGRLSALGSGCVKTPRVPDGFSSSWAQYTIRSGRRDEIQAALKAAGIPSMVYYRTPMTAQTAFSGLERRDCPVARTLGNTVLSLPIHPYMEDEEIDAVCSVIESVALADISSRQCPETWKQ